MKDLSTGNAPIDARDWKQKVHSIDMALRMIRTEATGDGRNGQGRPEPTRPAPPSTRASSPSHP